MDSQSDHDGWKFDPDWWEMYPDEVIQSVVVAGSDTLEEEFIKEHHLDGKSEGRACITRLFEEDCYHFLPYGSNEYPHDMPNRDHVDLWLRDGDPVIYTAHLYDLNECREDIEEFASEHGLTVSFDAKSWHYPGRTILVTLQLVT